MRKLADIVTSLWLGIIVLPKELFYKILVFWNYYITSSWNKLIVCVQILVGFGFNSDEHLEGQLLLGE